MLDNPAGCLTNYVGLDQSNNIYAAGVSRNAPLPALAKYQKRGQHLADCSGAMRVSVEHYERRGSRPCPCWDH